MARQKKTQQDPPVTDYRHADKRKNIPPAGLAGQGKVKEVPKTRYAYDPHLPPVLRFDSTGNADQLPELLQTARQRALTPEEAQILAEALRNQQPWLEWAGKREKSWFEVDPVALHIHERISAQAILKLAQREPLQRSLFADPELDYRQAIQFYQHDVDWSNRLILGDSLTVMHSLARREDLAGKVQMIYIDPPYGIKFASNFQSQVGKRDVKDRSEDLTREPEQIKAYRDTWTLGIHSYLAYLRDRFFISKELLTDSGSVFVQISDENLDKVRLLLDEIFGSENFVAIIPFRKKTMPLGGNVLEQMLDFLLWYTKDKSRIKYHQLYDKQDVQGDFHWKWYENSEGIRKTMTQEELEDHSKLDGNIRP
jgi:adenine-specific DNA-methyltransferase